MSVSELLKQRTSIRAFLDKPVSADDVRALLETARRSPSGGNLQPWKVIVVTGEEKNALTQLAFKRLMSDPKGEDGEYPIYPQDLSEPYRSRRYKVGEDMYALLGIPKEDKPARLRRVARNFEFFGAPVGLFFIIDRTMGYGQWAHLGMFMQSLALAAQEQGLATCMQEAWARLRETLHAQFELPENELIYCGMALGYADPDATINSLRSERAPVEDFAVFRGFDTN